MRCKFNLTVALLSLLKETPVDALRFTPQAFATLVRAVHEGTVSGRAGKEVLDVMMAEGGDPAAIISARGLQQLDGEAALLPTVRDVIAGNPEMVARFREGKTQLLGYFVGQVMKATKGRANPAQVKALLQEKLG